MEYWAIAVYDLGLTEEEFWELTPSMFSALRKRREMEFKYMCFANAIGAADYRNAHRTDTSQRVWSPMDYIVMDTEEDERLANEKSARVLKEMFGG